MNPMGAFFFDPVIRGSKAFFGLIHPQSSPHENPNFLHRIERRGVRRGLGLRRIPTI
jgi:hypothetical protein